MTLAMALSVGCSSAKVLPETDLCPGVRIRGDIYPGLNDAEKRLVCGDPELTEWRSIPKWQAEYNLKNFLQDRGFFSPKFIDQENGIWVEPGNPTRVSKVTATGAPDTLDLNKKRFLIGQVITPGFLGELEGWVSGQLKSQGYPCPIVKSIADPQTGEIRLNIETGPSQVVISVIEDVVSGVDPGAFRRFDAFKFGERFDDNLLTLTSSRITRRGVFDSAYFLPECRAEGAVLHQQVVVGPPRFISFQIGADTEGYIIGGASWTNARVGRAASLVNASALASSKEQSIYSEFDWSVFGVSERRSLRPIIEFSHANQRYFEYTQARFQANYQDSWEWKNASSRLLLGPQIFQIHTSRGTGPSNPRFLTLSGQFQIVSHDFELYLSQPRSGYSVTLTTDFSTRGIFSTTTAQRLGARVDSLWNLMGLDPPLVVLGFRGSLQTTVSPGQSQDSGDYALPPNFTYFLGGSQDLRGFGLLSLPGSGIGGLSMAFGGFESRFVQVAPYSIEPFVFIDAGAFGPLPATLREPIYYSPGLGVRWSPAFGAFRGTASRGYPLNAPGGWHFYFSFGEEF